MTTLWNNVKREHVIRAIQEFEKLDQDYPKPRNTFLVYNGKIYLGLKTAEYLGLMQ